MIRENALLVLDLCLDVVNRVAGFHVERNGLSGEGLDEDLHAEDQVQRRFLLDVVVTQRTTVLELLSGINQALLIRGNAFLVLDICLDVVNRVAGFHVERNGLSGEGLDENLSDKQ